MRLRVAPSAQGPAGERQGQEEAAAGPSHPSHEAAAGPSQRGGGSGGAPHAGGGGGRRKGRRVRFALGPHTGKYPTADGHPNHEGQVARQRRSLGLSWGHDLTPGSVRTLEGELGEENRPSLDRLKRRVGLLPLRKRPRDYLTWMLDDSSSGSEAEAEQGSGHDSRAKRRKPAGKQQHAGSGKQQQQHQELQGVAAKQQGGEPGGGSDPEEEEEQWEGAGDNSNGSAARRKPTHPLDGPLPKKQAPKPTHALGPADSAASAGAGGSFGTHAALPANGSDPAPLPGGTITFTRKQLGAPGQPAAAGAGSSKRLGSLRGPIGPARAVRGMPAGG